MVERRRQQRMLWEGWFPEEAAGWWEPWMKHADQVLANVVYRQFTRIGAEKVPDAKTMGRLVQALSPEVVQQIHQRMVGVAQEKKVVQGRKLRVDTTVVS